MLPCRRVPDDVEFATKPRQAIAVIGRAIDARVPFSWVTADEAYLQVKYLRVWLEDHDASYVLATKRNDLMLTVDGRGECRADEVVADLPARVWRRLSVGTGAHGPREYDWAPIPVRIAWRPGCGHWLLARHSISDPTEVAYYVCYGPRRSGLLDLAWIEGSRWRGEECFQQAKNEAGHNHEYMINFTVPEIRRLLAHLILPRAADASTKPAPATTDDAGITHHKCRYSTKSDEPGVVHQQRELNTVVEVEPGEHP